ncbi:MAG: hypothetical protein II859_04630 [Bacteroidales bacterium]|nr:hypothetical protein [Bacteroidales bacterium]
MKNISHIVILCLATAILLSGCGLMYGYKPIKQFDQKDYDQMITSVTNRDFKINTIVSDFGQFDAYRTCIQDSLWQHLTAVQPVQILYFKKDSLLSYHINCTAKGGLSNLNWNTNQRFETFPPATAVPITPQMQNISKIRDIYGIHDDSEYLIVVFWTNMLPKISKSAIETVKTNLRENGAANKADIVLVNTDKFYVTLQ